MDSEFPVTAEQINVSFEANLVTGYQSVDCFLLQSLVLIQLAVPLGKSRKKRQETSRHCFILLLFGLFENNCGTQCWSDHRATIVKQMASGREPM